MTFIASCSVSLEIWKRFPLRSPHILSSLPIILHLIGHSMPCVHPWAPSQVSEKSTTAAGLSAAAHLVLKFCHVLSCHVMSMLLVVNWLFLDGVVVVVQDQIPYAVEDLGQQVNVSNNWVHWNFNHSASTFIQSSLWYIWGTHLIVYLFLNMKHDCGFVRTCYWATGLLQHLCEQYKDRGYRLTESFSFVHFMHLMSLPHWHTHSFELAFEYLQTQSFVFIADAFMRFVRLEISKGFCVCTISWWFVSAC